ncbi:O-antigen ligase family protein [Mesorhizobium sp.]|jgi:hypothetical protein|uniref:O-antigen ligase family protein n=1 Tax=Mesorhizobium sp. TaxID=1871066 RepID=UPI003563022D
MRVNNARAMRIDGFALKSSAAAAAAIGANRRPARARGRSGSEEVKTESSGAKRLRLPVTLFLVSLLIPWIITVGPMRMSAYRFVLLIWLFPCLAMWLSGKAGRIRLSDISLLLYCSWCFLAISMIHGFGYAVQPSGMIFIETMGAYLFARCYIRDAEDFHAMVLLVFKLVAFMLPFAVVEAVTGRNWLLLAFSSINPTFPDNYLEPRWGLRRVQSVFEHPILFGVVCASALAPVHLVLGYGATFAERWPRTIVIAATAMLSLSAGPMTALSCQAMLLGWNWLLRSVPSRWGILCGLITLQALTIELLSNRAVPVVFMSYFSFDESSAYMRVLIWRYGSASVLNHPLFGIGFNPWNRPDWMTTSIDMYWIVDSIRHGLPAGLLLLVTFFSIYLPVAFRSGLGEKSSVYKTAYLITMTGFFLVGWTVYFWNATYVVFIFLLGSGVWLLDVERETGRSGRVTAKASEPARDDVKTVPEDDLVGIARRAGRRTARKGKDLDTSNYRTP